MRANTKKQSRNTNMTITKNRSKHTQNTTTRENQPQLQHIDKTDIKRHRPSKKCKGGNTSIENNINNKTQIQEHYHIMVCARSIYLNIYNEKRTTTKHKHKTHKHENKKKDQTP